MEFTPDFLDFRLKSQKLWGDQVVASSSLVTLAGLSLVLTPKQQK